MDKMVTFFLLIIIFGIAYLYFDYTKDYPMCRFSSDPILCVQVVRGNQ